MDSSGKKKQRIKDGHGNVYGVYISVVVLVSDADDVQISGCARGFLL